MRLIYLNNPQLNREQQGYIHNINQHVYNKKPLVIYFYKKVVLIVFKLQKNGKI